MKQPCNLLQHCAEQINRDNIREAQKSRPKGYTKINKGNVEFGDIIWDSAQKKFFVVDENTEFCSERNQDIGSPVSDYIMVLRNIPNRHNTIKYPEMPNVIKYALVELQEVADYLHKEKNTTYSGKIKRRIYLIKKYYGVNK